jgi:hypothetical protein
MSRGTVHHLVNELGGGIQFLNTSVTADESILSPATGKHLRVYEVILDGPSAMASDTGAAIRDGTADPINIAYFPASGRRHLDFQGRYWQVDTSLRITRPVNNNAIDVTIVYREVDNSVSGPI